MEELFRSYLSFLSSMGRGLEKLTELNEKKLAAVQADDLKVLNELLNEEQAQSLNFRGLEQTRDRLLPKLGLLGVPLSKVPERCPPAFREEVKRAVEVLQGQYRVYESGAKKTREVLERTREEVESMIIEMGGPAAIEGSTGYRREIESAPPPSMKTDFRA